MRAVVTGGAGFLGSHLTDRLVREGFDVVVVDNLVTGSRENIASGEAAGRVQFVEADACESLDIEGDVDWVFHFASPASPADFERIPIEVMRVNSIGTERALDLALQKGAKFMFASTSEVYGDPLISPQPETYWGNVNPIGVRGVYDESKRYGESLTMAYHRHRGLDTRIVRFFNTYGPRMRLNDGRVVPNFLTQALEGRPVTIYGDGNQTRSFGFVDDIVEGVWRLAQSGYHEPVNIGTQDEHTMLEFAQLCIEVVGSNSPIEFHPALPDDPKQRRPDLTRNCEVLHGWRPQVSLREGLRTTADFFLERLRSSGRL